MKQPVTQSMQYPKILYSEEYRGFKFYKTSTGLWYFEDYDLVRNWFTLVPMAENQPLLECAFYNDVSIPDSEHEHVKTMRKVIDRHIEYSKGE